MRKQDRQPALSGAYRLVGTIDSKIHHTTQMHTEITDCISGRKARTGAFRDDNRANLLIEKDSVQQGHSHRRSPGMGRGPRLCEGLSDKGLVPWSPMGHVWGLEG